MRIISTVLQGTVLQGTKLQGMDTRTSSKRAGLCSIALLAGGLLLCAALFPGLALASSEEHAGPTTADLLWQAANLALLLIVLVVLARKPIQNFFGDRRAEIVGDIESASELLKGAEQRHAEWQRKLADLESELTEIQSNSRQRAEEERDQILAAAHDTAERIKSDAVAAVDQELRRAQEELRDEAANLAVNLATQLLKENVDDRDRDRLLDEFITRVEPNSTSAGNEG